MDYCTRERRDLMNALMRQSDISKPENINETEVCNYNISAWCAVPIVCCHIEIVVQRYNGKTLYLFLGTKQKGYYSVRMFDVVCVCVLSLSFAFYPCPVKGGICDQFFTKLGIVN